MTKLSAKAITASEAKHSGAGTVGLATGKNFSVFLKVDAEWMK